MSYCVYWIRDKSHTDLMTQGYVGVSGNVQKRFASHKGMWKGTNAHLRHAIKKYGWDSLEKSVLLIADKDYCLEIERKLRSVEKTGWNLTVGGGFPPTLTGPQPKLRGRAAWNKGKKGVFSAETLAKMRQVRLGKSPANKGVPLSAERVEAMRQRNLGNTYRRGQSISLEARLRMSASHSGKTLTDDHKLAIGNALRGKKRGPMSDEQRPLCGKASKGKKWFTNGESNVFCLPGLEPVGYALGRVMPWVVKKDDK